MEKLNVPFAHGFYTSDSLPVSAQSCINFYPVIEDQPSLQQETLRGTPGIYHVANTGTTSADTNRGGHGLNGVPYFVFGTGLYRLESDETMTSLGTISGTKRCIFADNGTQLFIMQANGNGYIFTESPDTLTQITDVDYTTTNGTPQSVAFIDGYFVVTTDEKKFIVSALNDGLTWSALDFGTAESSPDGVVTPVVFQNQLFIGGERTIEAFTNIGGAGFPFTRSGLFLDAGISSVYSVVNAPNTFVWLGAGENEVPAIWMFEGNTKRKISTRAIDSILAGLSATKLLKVFAWAYSQGGNYFVGFNTHKNTTIVYDMTTERWHERRSYYTGMLNADGDPWRAGCLVDAYGKIYAGDQYSHKVGVLDPDIADEMDAAGGTTSNRIYREFSTMPFQNDMKNMFVPYIELVVEGGLEDTPGYPESGVDPLCEDYACDAFRTAAIAESDLHWAAESSYYTGALTRAYSFPESSGGTDCPVVGPTVHPSVPVITDACADSWKLDHVSGPAGANYTPTPYWLTDSDPVGYTELGVLAKMETIGTESNMLFMQDFGYRRDDGNEYYNWYSWVYVTLDGGTNYLRIGSTGFDTNPVSSVDIDALGIDPNDEHWYHTEYVLTKGSVFTVTQKVWVDGTLLLTRTMTEATGGGSPVNGVRFNVSGWMGLGILSPGRPDGWYSDLYYKGSNMELTNLSAAWARNESGYTAPAWCPGPAP